MVPTYLALVDLRWRMIAPKAPLGQSSELLRRGPPNSRADTGIKVEDVAVQFLNLPAILTPTGLDGNSEGEHFFASIVRPN